MVLACTLPTYLPTYVSSWASKGNLRAPHKSDYDVVGSLTKIKVFPWGKLPRRLLRKPEFQSASEMQARAPDSYFFLSLSLSHATCPSTAESSVTTLGSSDTLA